MPALKKKTPAKKTSLSGDKIQVMVDDLIWKHGSNLPHWGDYPKILMDVGLTPVQVTPQMINQAIHNTKRRLTQVLSEPHPEAKLTWREPVTEVNDLAQWTCWWTECRRYRVVRSVSTLSEGDQSFRVSYAKGTQHANHETTMAVLPNHFRGLRTAIESAERHFRDSYGLGRVESNAEIIYQHAEKNGLFFLPNHYDNNQGNPNSFSRSDDMFTITEKLARKTLAAAGKPEAKTWTLKRLTAKINDADTFADLEEPEEDKLKTAFQAITKALKADKEIVVGENKSDTTSGPSVKGDKASTNGTAKNTSPAKPAKEIKVDKFGAKEGTRYAQINKCFSKKPKTMKEIMEEAGVPGSYHEHFKALVDKKLVEKTDKGYCLPK